MDTRNAGEEVTLEITASGRGVIGDLDDLLGGVQGALAGYQVMEDGVDAHPFSMTEARSRRGDALPLFPRRRRGTEFSRPRRGRHPSPGDRASLDDPVRSRSRRDGPRAISTFPQLVAGVDGDQIVRVFDDMDLVTVDTGGWSNSAVGSVPGRGR